MGRDRHAGGLRRQQVADGGGLRLGEGRRAAVGLARRAAARAAPLRAPLPVVVAVQVDAVAAAVVAPVLAPHAAAVGVGLAVVLVAVGVDAGDDQDVARLDDAGGRRVGAVVGAEPVGEGQQRLARHRLAGVVDGVEPGDRLRRVMHGRSGGDPQRPDRTALEAVADRELRRHDRRVGRGEPVHLLADLRQGAEAAHRADGGAGGRSGGASGVVAGQVVDLDEEGVTGGGQAALFGGGGVDRQVAVGVGPGVVVDVEAELDQTMEVRRRRGLDLDQVLGGRGGLLGGQRRERKEQGDELEHGSQEGGSGSWPSRLDLGRPKTFK